MLIKKWTEELEQIEVSKASGGRIKDVPEEAWEDNNNWVAEDKLDGTRLKWHITKEGSRFTTRRISKKTNKYMERSDNFPHFRDMDLPELAGTVLDGEGYAPTHTWNDTTSIVGSSPEKSLAKQREVGSLEYWAFDIIKYKGEDVRNKSYRERTRLLDEVCMHIMSKYTDWPLFSVAQVRSTKKDYYNEQIAAGAEGIMLKNLNAVYGDKKGMIKVKKFQRFTMVITGFKPGTGKYKDSVGSIGVGFYGEGQLTYASGITDEQRGDMAANPDKYIGKTIEVECEEMTVSGKLRHPVFIGMRPEKEPKDCTRTQNDITK